MPTPRSTRRGTSMLLTALGVVGVGWGGPEDSVPTTTAEPLESMPVITLAPSNSSLEPPEIEPELASRIPEVAGVTFVPTKSVPWHLYDLPGGARAFAVDIRRGDQGFGQLVVAGRLEPNQLFDPYARTLFDEPLAVESVPVSQDATNPSAPFIIATNNALARWEAIHNAAVVVARVPETDAGRWVWEHDDLIWDVTGPLATEQFVGDLLLAQGAGLDPWDYQGLRGNLSNRFPTLADVLYWDLPRSQSLEFLQGAVTWPCAAEFFVSYIPTADDLDPEMADDRSMYIVLASIADACVGFFDDYAAAMNANPAFALDTVAGRPVHRGTNDVLYADGKVVIHFHVEDPTALPEHEKLIALFLDGQPI